MSQTKYCITPSFVPLWANKQVFAPDHGPLTKPTPLPVNIIGKLLLQSGKETVDLYEVVKQDKNWSDPVKLTLENYQLPYEEIINLSKAAEEPGSTSISDPNPPAPVNPKVSDKKEEEPGSEPQDPKEDELDVPDSFTDHLRGPVNPLEELSQVDPGDLRIQTNAELAKKVEEEKEAEMAEGTLESEQSAESAPVQVPVDVMEQEAAETAAAAEAFAASEEGQNTVTVTDQVIEEESKEEDPAEPEAETQPEEQVERAEDTNTVDEIADKRTMTKAERKRAAREAREREAAEALANQNNG